MQNKAWHCPTEIDMEFLGKVIILTAAYVSPKFQHKPPNQLYFHRLVFELFLGNSLNGLFHLWHMESDFRFSQKQAEMWTRLTREHVSTVFRSISDDFGPRELSSVSAENE